MITTLTASRLCFVRRDSATGWDSRGAMQGMWADDGTPRTGAMLFPGMTDTDWRSRKISRIEMTMTFTNAGYSRAKTVGLYRGAQPDIVGSGGEMRGAFIGSFYTKTRAYKSVVTCAFDEANDPEVFSGLVGWLEGGVPTLVTWMDDPDNGWSYTDNYLRITACTLVITHEVAGSGGRLDKARLDAGETIALTVEPLDEADVTHSVEWAMGDASISAEMDGLTASFTVPMDWLYQMPDAASGAAQCRLTTYVSGQFRAVRTLPFTVDVPADVLPEFDAVIQPSGTDGGYYQHLGGAVIRAENAVPGLGAGIAMYSIVGAEGEVSASSSLTTANFREAGAHEYVIAVTDSRGRTREKIVSAAVNPLAEPVIHSFSVRRYASKIDDAGDTVYYDSLGGGYVWVNIDAAIDPAGGNNAAIAYILYGDKRIDVDFLGAELQIENGRNLITAKIPLNAAHGFTLVLSDRHSETSAFSRVEKSWAPVHLAGSGFGAAFGGFSTAVEAAPEVRTYWPLYGSDGFQIDGFAKEVFETLTSPFQPDESNPPRVLRAGRMVQLAGACSSSSSISGSITEHTILTLPRAYWPAHDVYQVCQGGTTRIWLMHVDTSGQVTFSRYHYGSGYESLSAGSQLLLNAAWIAMDSPVETPDDGGDDAELTYFTYPESAMTSDSSQSCVASVSSRQSSTYAAYRAFDNERGNAWASASGESSAWIQLQMPQALKKISVKAYTWSSSNKYKGDPISGAVMGSNDGALWTTIGTFSGWSEGDGGLLGEVVCDNSDAYSYVRLNITAWTSGKSYVAIGYITITGGVPVE